MSYRQNYRTTKVVESGLGMSMCAKTFTTDRGLPTYRYPIFTHTNLHNR